MPAACGSAERAAQSEAGGVFTSRWLLALPPLVGDRPLRHLALGPALAAAAAAGSAAAAAKALAAKSSQGPPQTPACAHGSPLRVGAALLPGVAAWEPLDRLAAGGGTDAVVAALRARR